MNINSKIKRILLVLLIFATVFFVFLILYVYNPSNYLYPGCLFRGVTGLYCPGCGATRASHFLLHGDLINAVRMNALFVIALPGMIAFFLKVAVQYIREGTIESKKNIKITYIYIFIGIIIVYWIVRNIPIYPFYLK